MTKIRFMTLEGLLELRENDEDFTLVEVLGQDYYDEGHIPGAEHIALDEIEERAPEELEKDETVVVYCASYTCHASTKAARKLVDMGFTDVWDFKASKEGWTDAGYELET